jgi:superfamily I DNA/RNA helicase
MQLLDGLNTAQRAAVTAGDGAVLIVAGPGTGKTKTLTARIAYLVASGQALPEQILALTFTKKAAEEMQTRVQKLLAPQQKNVAVPRVSTFHALCHEILGGELSFATESDRSGIIKGLTKPAAYKRATTRELGLLISRYKNQAEDDPALQTMTAAYNDALAALGVADFDDLLVRTKRLLQDDMAMRVTLQQRYTHILVDEFQDTNMLQYDLLRLLLSHENIVVIGDPNQSIYGFRGASGGIFDQFRADYPAHTAIMLGINYRSAPEVVAVGNAVFADSQQLTAHRTSAGTARAIEVLNEYSEANWVTDTIHRAVGGGDFLHAVSDNDRAEEYTLKDFAVLYRNRWAAAALQKAIAGSGLPYQVVGDGSPYDLPQVQRLVAVLRGLVAEDQQAPDGFTVAEWHALQMLLQQKGDTKPATLAEKACVALGFEIVPALSHFIGTLVRFQTVAQAIKHIDAIAGQGFYDPSADAITLLTIHASKGLEFPYVFLIGAEEGILPGDRADELEEQRLFYVAATRARDNLGILHARYRGGEQAMASRFIQALPHNILPRSVDPQLIADQRRAQKRAAKRSQQSLF